MKKNIKFKGRLRNYLLSPMLLTILLILMNVPIYIYQLRAGLMVSAFVVIYFVVVFTIYHKNKALFVTN